MSKDKLKALRNIIVAYKANTVARSDSRREQLEVETIQKTLNVVLAEIDTLRFAGKEEA